VNATMPRLSRTISRRLQRRRVRCAAEATFVRSRDVRELFRVACEYFGDNLDNFRDANEVFHCSDAEGVDTVVLKRMDFFVVASVT
jgi:hypothetical protein